MVDLVQRGWFGILMDSDEHLYEEAANELAESPRQGLLIKCMTNAGGEEAKGKASYIEIRVNEMKSEIAEKEAKKNQETHGRSKIEAPHAETSTDTSQPKQENKSNPLKKRRFTRAKPKKPLTRLKVNPALSQSRKIDDPLSDNSASKLIKDYAKKTETEIAENYEIEHFEVKENWWRDWKIIVFLKVSSAALFCYIIFFTNEGRAFLNSPTGYWEKRGDAPGKIFHHLTKNDDIFETHRKLKEDHDVFVSNYNSSASRQAMALALNNMVRNSEKLVTEGLPIDYRKNLIAWIDNLKNQSKAINGSFFPDRDLISKLNAEEAKIWGEIEKTLEFYGGVSY